MDTHEDILTFLQLSENLPVALEVARHVEALRPRLHQAFWKNMDQAFEERLKNSNYANRWKVTGNGQYDKAWRYCKIEPVTLPNTFTGSVLCPGIMQGDLRGGFPIHYGLVWSPKDRKAPSVESYRELLRISRQLGFEDRFQNDWWPTCRYFNVYLRNDDFVLRFGLNPTEFVNDLADTVWEYFIVLEPTLYQLRQDMIAGM